MSNRESSDALSSIAGNYLHFGQADLVSLDEAGQARLVTAVRALAASVLSQDETPGKRKVGKLPALAAAYGLAGIRASITCEGRENDYADDDTPSMRLRKIAANLVCYVRREDVELGNEAHGFALEAMDQYADHILGVVGDLEQPSAGTHIYELLAASETHHVEVTDTLISMVAATVLAKLIEDEGGGRSNVTFGPQDMDTMHRDYEMTVTRDGLLTTVKLTPRPGKLATHAHHDLIAGQAVETEASLMVQDEDTTGALPQAEAQPAKPYIFFNSGQTGRVGPMEADAAQSLVLESTDPTARVENRNCPLATCPNSDQQTSCSICAQP